MKICVTGANGFIGSKVIEQLKEKYDIVALNRKYSEIMGNVTYIKTDYSYEELIHTLKGCTQFYIWLHRKSFHMSQRG